MEFKKIRKKIIIILTVVVVLISTFCQMDSRVYALENTMPTQEQFATKEQLKTFNTNDSDGTKKSVKIYFGNNNQEWWIVGSQSNNALTLFSAKPIISSMTFEGSDDRYKTYQDEWNCDYNASGFSDPDEVFPNHYGGSMLRKKLQELERSFFSDSEQNLMNKTTIYTEDDKNKSTYATTDELYLPAGYFKERYITAGSNNGLRIDSNYWIKSRAWLRTPEIDGSIWGGMQAVTWYDGLAVAQTNVEIEQEVVPAFELNLSNVIFGSTIPAIKNSGKIEQKDAMTLRYNSNTMGKATISFDKAEVNLEGVSPNSYLVVQNSNGAYAKKIGDEKSLLASDINSDLSSFKDCKVWLETTDTKNRMTYATLAVEERGYNVNVETSEGLTVTNGTQYIKKGSAIKDITVKVAEGYYLPADYISTLKKLTWNELKINETNNGFTITGTPTNDVDITLPKAKIKTSETVIDHTGGIVALINGTTTNKYKISGNSKLSKGFETTEATETIETTETAEVSETEKLSNLEESDISKSSKDKQNHDKGSVETGKKTNIGLFIVPILIVVLGGTIFVVLKKKKS